MRLAFCEQVFESLTMMMKMFVRKYLCACAVFRFDRILTGFRGGVQTLESSSGGLVVHFGGSVPPRFREPCLLSSNPAAAVLTTEIMLVI